MNRTLDTVAEFGEVPARIRAVTPLLNPGAVLIPTLARYPNAWRACVIVQLPDGQIDAPISGLGLMAARKNPHAAMMAVVRAARELPPRVEVDELWGR